VAFGFYFREDVGDLALSVDDEGGAFYSHHLLPVHVLLFDHAEGVADCLVWISEKRIGEVVLLFEGFLFGGGVGGDAENDGAGLLDLLECVAEPARFKRSTGRIGLGVEEQHHVLSLEIFGADGYAVFIRQRELRGFIINFHRFSVFKALCLKQQ
jgi:hypothetical protein